MLSFMCLLNEYLHFSIVGVIMIIVIYIFFFVFVNLFVSGLYCITSLFFFFFVFFLLLFLCCNHKNLVEKVEEKGLVSGVFSTALPKAPIRLF